jgi:DNA-binding response OmpR family regulator
MNRKPSILLVDDEIAITDNLAPFLSRSGFTGGRLPLQAGARVSRNSNILAILA